MSYRVKYRVEFFDQLGREKRVDVLELGYSGSIEVVEGSGDPLRIGLQNSADEKYETLQPTYIELTVLAKTKFKFEEIAGGTDKQYKMEVWEDGSLKHVGFIIPQIYQEPYEEPPFPVTFRAVSMGILNRTRYLDSNGDFFTGKVSAMTVITRCLDRLGYGLDIWDSANTYESRMNSASTDSPLTQVQIDQEAYIVDDRGEQRAMYCWDVLEAVLKPFVVNFFQDYGRWVIIPIEERASARTVRVFNSSGVFQSSHSRNPSDDILWIERGHTLQPRPIIREVESEYQHQLVDGLIRRGEMSDDFFVRMHGSNQEPVPDERWITSSDADFNNFTPATSIPNTVPTQELQEGATKKWRWNVSNDIISPFPQRLISQSAYYEYVGDFLEFKDFDIAATIRFSFRIVTTRVSSSGQDTVRQRIQFRVGNYYLNADGSWTLSPTDIELEVLASSYDIVDGWVNIELNTQNFPQQGEIRARIYCPSNDNDRRVPEIIFSEYQYFTAEMIIDGKEQEPQTVFIGERDVDSYAEVISYDLLHGNGPTSLHKRSFIFDGEITSQWHRDDLTGGISDIAINEILREYENRSNVIQGRHRVESLFDRYFAEFGEAYVPLSGVYHERMCWFDGQVIQIQAGDTQGTVRVYDPRRTPRQLDGFGEPNVRPDLDRLQAIGEITRDYEEESADTLDCLLDVPVRKGIEYWVVNEAELSRVNRFDGVYPVIPQTTDISGNRLVPSDANYDDESNIREYGPGLLEEPGVPIQVQTINAPAGSLIYKAPGQDEIDQNVIEDRQDESDEKIDELDVHLEQLDIELENLNDVVLSALQLELDNLNNVVLPELDDKLDDLDDEINNLNNTVLPSLEGEIDTLDGYFQNPSTIPSGYNFFTGIVANNGFINSLVTRNLFTDSLAAKNAFVNAIVANNAFINSLVTRNLFTDTLAANNTFTNELVANNTFTNTLAAKNAFVNSIVANNTFTDTLVAKNAFVLDLVARNTFTDALAAKTAFIDELVANTAFINEIFSKNVSITGELTMGSSGEISNSARSYKILDTGFGVYTAANISTQSSYTVYNANTAISGDVAVLRIGAAVNASTNIGDAIIEANVSTVGLIIRSNGSSADMTLRSERHLTISTQFGTGELRLRVNSNEGMNISGLPTTNPGGTNNVWRDGTTLRIT